MGAGQDDPGIVVIGGGPAGAAAAIACATRGLSVTLLERDAFDSERPGETMHPGVRPVLEQLGLGARLDTLATALHAGVHVQWGDAPERFQPYGADENGAWLGFQLWRQDFDQAMLEVAAAAGVRIRQPCAVRDVTVENGVVRSVETDEGPLRPALVIDASGRSRQLARRLGLSHSEYSRRLVARYGYVTGSCPLRDDAPRIVGDATGWTWTARIRDGLYQWTRVNFEEAPVDDGWSPDEFRGMAALSRTRGADVTWRIADRLAGENWFLVGDAAATLDPTSARGVLKSLLTGMMAGHLASASLSGKIPAATAAQAYDDWLKDWFRKDVQQMASFYETLK